MEPFIKDQIKEIVDRETEAWDTQNIEKLLSVFHPDMVWPWPITNKAHDPMNWVLELGRFHKERWSRFYGDFFRDNELVLNRREIKKIEITKEGDGAFAVVDIDTQWKNRSTGEIMRWEGRVCKVYVKLDNGWKLTMHTGVLKY